MRPLLVAAVVLAGLCACGNGRFLRVAVPDLPAEAAVLYALVNADGRDALPEEFTLAAGHGASESFTLDIDGAVDGPPSAILTLGVGARDGAGCELGWGTLKLVPAGFGERIIDVEIPIGREAPGVCNFQRDPGMLRVAAGTYLVGCDATRDPTCFDDERPQRPVTLAQFQIDGTEVVVGEYDACVRARACAQPIDSGLGGPLAGRNYVDYFRAHDFCAWRGKRLPTEAEWEAAARGGDGRIYPWSDAPPDCRLANFAGLNASGRRCNAGDSARNIPGNWPDGRSPVGAFDLAGNLAEWVNDWYESRASLPASAYASGPLDGEERVVKGGSYIDDARGLRVSSRYGYFPDGRLLATSDPSDTLDVGFRCAK